jgi:hypothetical protein
MVSPYPFFNSDKSGQPFVGRYRWQVAVPAHAEWTRRIRSRIVLGISPRNTSVP